MAASPDGNRTQMARARLLAQLLEQKADADQLYYLYPIMNKYMRLNSLQRIEGAIDQFITLISKEYQEASPLAMPITRDLPQSRRQVLEVWAKDLMSLGYPPRPLKLSNYQPG